MTWLKRCGRRLRGVFSRFGDRAVREEVDLHLDLLAEEFRDQGFSELEARSRAERAFGNRTRTVELTRAVTTLPWLEKPPERRRLWRAAAPSEPRGHHPRGRVAGRRHRRQHRSLFDRRCTRAPLTARTCPGQARRALARRPRNDTRRRFALELRILESVRAVSRTVRRCHGVVAGAGLRLSR